MDKKEAAFILSGIPPFQRLSAKGIEGFISRAEIKEYSSGEVIYQEFGPPDYFYVLCSGNVLVMTGAALREIEVLKRGTCFGIISLFTEDPHSVTTKAIGQTVVLRLEKEKFREFLGEHPLLSLDFSRLLSQRVKRRVQPKTIFQTKHIGIIGARGSGKTSYMVDLSRELAVQTSRKVVCVELTQEGEVRTPTLINKPYQLLSLRDFRPEDIEQYIVRDSVDFLFVDAAGAEDLEALLDFLSENYHFVLYEIPEKYVQKHFTQALLPAHSVHYLLFPTIADLTTAAACIRQVQEQDACSRPQVKVILNEAGQGGIVEFQERKGLLGYPIYATLPLAGTQEYIDALRRIAREIGEVVVGIALGGGGACGFAHIGVLKTLTAHAIPIDILCGSSTGSVMAGLWALGLPYDEVLARAKEFAKKLKGFSFSSVSFPFKGILKSRRLESILKGIFGEATFYDLKYGLKIVTFDFLKREVKILEEGLLYKAVAASCAYPGIFEPVMMRNALLLDGAIATPLPTKELLECGAHKIIAVNITPSRDESLAGYAKKKAFHILDFIFGSIETMQQALIIQASKIADVVIHPDLSGLNWLDFEHADEFVERGAKATEEKIPEIKRAVFQ
jgi:NTE family protein